MSKASSALFALCVFLPVSVSAQTPRARSTPDETKAEAPAAGQANPPRFSLFGDTTRFTRMGGWGGMAGTMAQFGVTKAMLVMMPGVQKELKMTDKQKEDIKEWAETFRKRGEELAQKAGIGPGGPPQGDARNITSQIFKFMNFMTTLNDFFKEAEDAANKILSKQQQTRLNQIALQMEGLSALSRPEVAQQMNLDPQQFEAIQQILNGARAGQMTYWVGQMTRMATDGSFRRPGGNRQPGGDGGGQGPQGPRQGFGPGATDGRFGGQGRFARPGATADTGKTAKADTTKDAAKNAPEEEPEDPAEAEKRRKEREAARAAMRKRFETMQQGSDSIQNAAVTQILKLLTKGQKARFDKMLGEPFDPDKLVEPPDLAEQRAAAAKAAAAKANTQTRPEAPRGSTLRERRLGRSAMPPQ